MPEEIPKDDPGDTDEFDVPPLPTLKLTRKAAEELFKFLNSMPIKEGENVLLVGNHEGQLTNILYLDRSIMYWLSD